MSPARRFRMYPFREPVNGFTHLGGAVFGVVALVWLISRTYHDLPLMLAVTVYSVCIILLYLASSVMHLYNGPERIIARLNQLDHAAIYLLIAGTYTPFCYGFQFPNWQIMLALVWGLAIVGAITKLVFFWRGFKSVVFYLLIGWVALFGAPFVIAGVEPGAIVLVLLGGVTYSVGAVFFALRRPNFHRWFGHHELWHVFVLAASLLHFIAVLVYVV